MLPADLAVSKNNTTLQGILNAFSPVKGINTNRMEEVCVKYSEVDNILLALEATDYISAFKEHRIDLQEFLLLNEADLITIGIEKVGLRKKMLEVIVDMHKREWEKSSVPKITPRDKQQGIYLSAPGTQYIYLFREHVQQANLKPFFRWSSYHFSRGSTFKIA